MHGHLKFCALHLVNSSSFSPCEVLNIYVILSTEDAIEVVLNALAFIFIAQIDEDLAKTGWYDGDKRWLTAGAMQTAMLGMCSMLFFMAIS